MNAPSRAETLAALRDILEENRLLTLATVSPDGEAHANIAFFAYEPDFRLRIVSPPDSEHCRYLEANPSAAVTVFDSRQQSVSRRGAQLFGTICGLSGEQEAHAFQRFVARFSDSPRHASRRIYEFTPSRAKVFDEGRLVRNEYVGIDFERSAASAR